MDLEHIIAAIIFIILALGVAYPSLSMVILGQGGGPQFYDTWTGTGGIPETLSHDVVQVDGLWNLTLRSASNTTATSIPGESIVSISSPSNYQDANITICHTPITIPQTVYVNGNAIGYLTTGNSSICETTVFSGSILIDGNNQVSWS